MHHEEDDLNLLEKMGYEGRDMEVGRGGQIGAVMLFVVLGVVTLACWAFIGLVDRTNKFSAPPQVAERTVVPPKDYPVVQTGVSAKMDMVELRKLEEQKTTKLGWVDKDKGVAQIPVETAIKIVAERGLPSKPTASTKGDTP